MQLQKVQRTTLTMREEAEYLGISYWLINQLVRKKQIPCCKVGGKYWYRGGVNWVAIIVFAIGVAFFLGVHQLPIFVNTIGATFIDMCLSGILYYGIMLLVDRKEDELCY